ncbi:MAG TPA: ABC transporter permease [Blastocatellia bacterium]|nr:ABC transporter permease [Blastocatellia bacterium]
METFLRDFKYGFRMLLKHPAFTAIAVIALALGIGANTAIFSVVNAVLLQPLPFADPERLVSVYETNLQRGYIRGSASYPNFADLREQNQVFEKMSSYHTGDFILTGGDEPLRLQGAIVNADLFSLLGAAPSLGRTFLPEEDKPGDSGRVVILSSHLWRNRFGSDPNVIGATLVLGGKNFTVVGVMPEAFKFPVQNEPVELWSTVAVDAAGEQPMTGQRGAHYMNVIARLKPGVGLAQARAEMDTIAARLEQQYPDTNSHRGVFIEPALESLVVDIRLALLVLLGAVGCVLLIACANVANLLLARATTRHKEMAIRAALGASRMRVVRQLLTESVMLSLAGGSLGLLLALSGTRFLVAIIGSELPRSAEIGLDARVLGFTLLVSLLTGVVFGLVPALYSSKTDLTEALKEGGRSSGEGSRRNKLRGALVVIEVAIAVVLLSAAGLMIQSLLRLQRVNPGFNPKNVLSFSLGLPEVRYPAQKQIDFYNQLVARIESLPGVRSASAVLPLPLSSDRIRITFETEGRPLPRGELPASEYRAVGLNYFRTMGIPILRGRDIAERDDKKSTPVIVVNDTFAQKFFPGEDPIGKHIKPGIGTDDSPSVWREIVGVVGSVSHLSLSADPDPEYYVPHAQMPFDSMTIVARTEGDPRSLISAVRSEVRALDGDLPVYNFKTLEEYVAGSVAQPRFNTLLLAIFAGIALVLTAVGLYGVMSYSVTQRTHEIGIRMALGAGGHDVLKMVVRQGMTLTLVGMGAGLAGAYFLTRFMESLLFGVSATDPITFIGISVVLAGVALGACFVPARRATRVDPMIALRYE